MAGRESAVMSSFPRLGVARARFSHGQVMVPRTSPADKGEHPAAVAALLALGADPNAKNARGRTPLAVAASARFDRTVALLRAAGAR